MKETMDLELSENAVEATPNELRILEQLSILVVSNQEFCDRIAKAVDKISKQNYEWVTVKTAENLDQICLSEKSHTLIDYVAIVVDTKGDNPLHYCRKNLSLMKPTYLASRTSIINGSCRSGSFDEAQNLIKLADEFNIPIFNGEIKDKKSCDLTSEKIFKMALDVAGITFGIPFLIPTPYDMGLL